MSDAAPAPAVLAAGADRDPVRPALGRPSLGQAVAAAFSGLRPRIPARPAASTHASRSYRFLARRVALDLPRADSGRTILFSAATSPEASGEAMLMFASFMREEVGCRVLLVDASFRDGGLTDMLGACGAPGLLDLLGGDPRDLAAVVRPTERRDIAFLPAGRLAPRDLPSPDPARVAAIVRAARATHDYILLQQGPIYLDTRYLPFADATDLVLLLAEEGETLLDDFERCVKVMRDHHVMNVRLVLSTPR